jgi:hypothetical protein
MEPEVGELGDEPLVALPRPRRAPASTPSSPTLRAAAAGSATSLATYEPSGLVVARSATRRQSHGAKQDTEPVWHAGPAGTDAQAGSRRRRSPSRSSSTASVLPEVSPLRQRRSRERLKK